MCFFKIYLYILNLRCLSHQIDSAVSSDVSHEAFRPVFSTFTMLLVDMNLPLNLKVMQKGVVCEE